ncbi:MAG: hypothetical protein ACRDWE_09125, partial [Acidimicrobiales bacterium]
LQELDAGVCLHLAALIFPVSERQADDLAELMVSEEDPQERHELAQLWVEELADLWSTGGEGKRPPVRYLEDQLTRHPAPANEPAAGERVIERDLLAAA